MCCYDLEKKIDHLEDKVDVLMDDIANLFETLTNDDSSCEKCGSKLIFRRSKEGRLHWICDECYWFL